jgi:hypothetical protein
MKFSVFSWRSFLSIMFPSLLAFSLTQTIPQAPAEIVQFQQVRPLPGHMDAIPVVNSNSPELLSQEGILLSTFPPDQKKVPNAHLNFPLRGRFDIFAHHVVKAKLPTDLRSLYLGIILYNPGFRPVKVNILQAASYLSYPDAPFIDLPPLSSNDLGEVFAGPGDLVMADILRGKRQATFPAQIIIPPQQSRMLVNLPIPVEDLNPPLNGRSTLIRLSSSNQVYVASLALFARLKPDGSERSPNLVEWVNLLNNGALATPRDKIPTPPQDHQKPFRYGRVSGVAKGSLWRSLIIDSSQSRHLYIPEPGQAFSYGLSTLDQGTLGTGQIQSAPMLVRYPDTAYRAHGNYGIEYKLQLPLYNHTQNPQVVTIAIQTPIKENQLHQPGLRFFSQPAGQVFFRGTVRVRYQDDQGYPRNKFVHLVQRRGEQGQPLLLLHLKRGDIFLVEVDFLYPPDATPPQVLTVSTAP